MEVTVRSDTLGEPIAGAVAIHAADIRTSSILLAGRDVLVDWFYTTQAGAGVGISSPITSISPRLHPPGMSPIRLVS